MLSTDVQRTARRQRRKGVKLLMVASLGVLALLALVIGAPFILLAIGPGDTEKWLELSYIGQTYGGIAGALGALALAGVAASLVVQVRESITSREQYQRQVHMDLLFRAIDDADLRACLDSPGDFSDTEQRQTFYLNLWVSFWNSLYVVGKLAEPELRGNCQWIFATEPGRRYWTVSGPFRKSVSTSRRDIAFNRIVDDEHRKAVASLAVGTPTLA